MQYSDNYLSYDMLRHRYVLTEKYVEEKMNVSLSEILDTSGNVLDVSNMSNILLSRVSMQIYNYIYNWTALKNECERRLALDETLRQPLMDAMAEQLIYIINNGDIASYAGINMSNGMVINQHDKRLSEIAPIAKDIIINAGIIHIWLTGERDIKPTYEEDSY